MIQAPCFNCTERTADPNCHNEEICAKWAAYKEEHDKEVKKIYEERTRYGCETRQLVESMRRAKGKRR